MELLVAFVSSLLSRTIHDRPVSQVDFAGLGQSPDQSTANFEVYLARTGHHRQHLRCMTTSTAHFATSSSWRFRIPKLLCAANNRRTSARCCCSRRREERSRGGAGFEQTLGYGKAPEVPLLREGHLHVGSPVQGRRGGEAFNRTIFLFVVNPSAMPMGTTGRFFCACWCC